MDKIQTECLTSSSTLGDLSKFSSDVLSPPEYSSDVGLADKKSKLPQTQEESHASERRRKTKSGMSFVSIRTFNAHPDENSMSMSKPVAEESGVNMHTTLVRLTNAIGSDITIIDYSPTECHSRHLELEAGGSNDVFNQMLHDRENWSEVRWINVVGLTWEAMEAIGRLYDLHPLVIEDMLDAPQHGKIDVFGNVLYASFPLHIMETIDVSGGILNKFFSLFSRKSDNHDAENPPSKFDASVLSRLQKMPSRSLYQWDMGEIQLVKEMNDVRTRDALLMGRQTQISVEHVSLLYAESTVVTFFEKSALPVVDPIMTRIMTDSTILRRTSDPAILVQALLDACVDMIGPVIDEYHSRICSLQIKTIRQPTLYHTRSLHILTSDLMILQRSVGAYVPLARAFETRSLPTSRTWDCPEKCKLSSSEDIRHDAPLSLKTIISDDAALYFGQVLYHAESYAKDLDIIAGQTKTISKLIYNIMSINSSDSVKLLSLVTVIFAPLTFLTGFFGMNFKSFNVLEQDVSYFWILAVPVTIALILLLIYKSLAIYCVHWAQAFGNTLQIRKRIFN